MMTFRDIALSVLDDRKSRIGLPIVWIMLLLMQPVFVNAEPAVSDHNGWKAITGGIPDAQPRDTLEEKLAKQYCSKMMDAAQEARFAWQMKTLKELQTKIDERITALEQKIAKHQKWLDRRKKFLQETSAELVQVYAKMRPETAAAQLSELNELAAAAILTKLSPRNSSAVFNEMETKKAARLAAIIAGAAEVRVRAGEKK